VLVQVRGRHSFDLSRCSPWSGTLAAAFQAWAYGGFTPAGGVFATFTSLGMLGYLRPLEVVAGATIATVVTLIVWACGVGR